MDQFRMIKVKVLVHYDSIEELLKGNCEITTNTNNIPYGNWKYCEAMNLEVETDEDV